MVLSDSGLLDLEQNTFFPNLNSISPESSNYSTLANINTSATDSMLDNSSSSLSLDVDGNGVVEANRDGLLIYGYLNIKDIPIPALMDQLADNLADPNGLRTTGSAIASYLQAGLNTMLDVDGNGIPEANRDGLLIYGDLNVKDIPIPALMAQLAENLADPDGIRHTGTDIKEFLDDYLEINEAPIFQPVDDLIVMPGDRLDVQLSATDPEGEEITFALQGEELPTGMLKAHNVGIGRVSNDGSVIETVEGGVINSSLYFFAPPPPEESNDPENNEKNEEDQCKDCKVAVLGPSLVQLHSGAVIETHDLVSYESLGVNRGFTLTYDSERADSRQILHFDYSNVIPNPNRRLMAELTVQQGTFEYEMAGGRNYWSIPAGGGDIEAGLQGDMRGLASGRYDYELKTGLLQLNGETLSGSTTVHTGKIVHVNSIGSVFGNGWNLSGLLEIVENADGSALMIDGDGGELVFEALPGGGYHSPSGDFSVLEKLSDGTFRRTMTDQTVYTFNEQNQIASMRDSNGNTTQYLYNSEGNISSIIDPVGLETTFTYTNGKVTKITDPADRETLLEYDPAGNLAKITDPDGTFRTWEYDTNGHITAEIDKRGNDEQMFYDFAGRADRAIRKDGSELDFDPVQVQGLYAPELTLDPISAPEAFPLGEAKSTYTDANGNIITYILDRKGQLVSVSDEVGIVTSIERNSDNLVSEQTDALGNFTQLLYDDQGNIITVFDELGNSIESASVDLSSLNGNNGFIVKGTNAYDYSGFSVSSAGDINGDGFGDVIIGARGGDPNGNNNAGESYVVFGSNSGFQASLDLSALNGSNGFVINGINNYDRLGISVSNAGDVNGDGFDDLIIGAYYASPNGIREAGQSYVVFGRSDGFGASLNLLALNSNSDFEPSVNLSAFDGSNGFVINGIDNYDYSGRSVSGAGDVNGDGLDDLIIGAERAEPNGKSYAGESYVVFGRSDGFGGSFNLSALNGSNGFVVNGIDNYDRSGHSVSGAGDINGDGFDDVIIGAYRSDPNGKSDAGESYLVFGGGGAFPARLDPSTLNGSNGFVLNGIDISDRSGISVSSAGDINGDGLEDLIIGASGADPNGRSGAGESYVVFGSNSGFGPTLDLSTLNGSNGFVINGVSTSDNSGISVSSAGDVNGDGIDDLIIGARYASPNGNTNAGKSYVVFGRSDGFGASFDLSTLDGSNGFVLNGIDPTDYSGISVSGAGDVNGDGLADLIIGSERADPNGTSSGESYVVFGGSTRRVSLTYDDTFNQTTSITDELGRQTLFEIDPNNGNTLSITQVIGEVGGDDDLITRFTYTDRGLVDLQTDPLGRVTDYDYNEFGRLIRITDAKGTVDEAFQEFEHDDAGNITAAIDENLNRTVYEYDDMNRITRIIEADPDGNGPLTSPITQFEYDKAGNLELTIDARGNIIRNEYDELDRLVKTTEEIAGEEDKVTQFEYDHIGNLTKVIDPNKNPTINRYDERNRLIETEDAEEGVTKFKYDLNDNLRFLTDPKLNTTEFRYDFRDRLVEEIDPLDKSTTYQYDATNNLRLVTDRNSRVTRFDYDDVDRLIRETWVGDVNVINYNYDKNSNLTSVQDDFSALTYTYDFRDRVKTIDNLGTFNVPRVVLNYDYDGVGNVLSVQDTINGNVGGTNSYDYDALNRLTQLEQFGNGVSDKRVDFAYNPLGQFESIKRYSDLNANNLVVGTTYNYDELNRLTNITQANSTETVAFYDYGYDDASRITSISDVDGVTTYSYDPRNQLTGADHSDPDNPDESYEYDANGNRIQSHLHGQGYVTGKGNRLLSDGTYNYEYDDEGNMSRRIEIATGDVREFYWDYRNRLREIIDRDAEDNEIQRVEFTYDALNRRISKAVDTNPEDFVEAVVTHFVYDGVNVLLDFVDQDGFAGVNAPVFEQRYLHGAVVDQVLAQEDGEGNIFWHLSDHLGTIRDLVDETGIVANHLIYDSFGQVIDESDPEIETRYSYTGREFDEETGLYYYRARYYDTEIGRFISEDPIGFFADGTNFYGYIKNSPLTNTDPTGLDPKNSYEELRELLEKDRKRKENIKDLARKSCDDPVLPIIPPKPSPWTLITIPYKIWKALRKFWEAAEKAEEYND